MPQAMSKFKYEGVIYDIKDAEARQDLAECVNNGYYDSNAKKIILRHDSDIIVQIDATDFIKDGMVSNVQIINGYLVITFNTDSGQEPISIPITDIFNPDNYYNKSATNALLALKQNVIQDLEVIRQGAEAGATAYQKPQGGIPKTDMSDDVKESLEKADDAAPKTEVEEHYARKDGYYETLGAGTANNLKSDITTDREIMYDKSGGLNDIDSGSANLSRVQGNTIAWNQFVQNGDFSNGSTNWRGGQGTVSNGIYSVSWSIKFSNNGIYPNRRVRTIANHKYFCKAWVKNNMAFNIIMGIGLPYSYADSVSKTVLQGEDVMINGIFGATRNSEEGSSGYGFKLYSATVLSDTTLSIDTTGIMCIDLTLIYGAGNEPTSVEQFEADYQRWFGKPLTYEPYNEGGLRNVMMSAIKTTGFNQWDEEYLFGYYSGLGVYVPADNQLCSKNPIKVFPSTTYYFNKVYTLKEYDRDMNFIKSSGALTNKLYTTDANTCYVHIGLGESYGAVYHNDVCINISTPDRNGTYEPYKENIASLPITTLTGKLNGQGESVTIFPDGMKSVGDIRDEIFVENGVVKAIKRVGARDLGGLSSNWHFNNNVFWLGLNDYKKRGSNLLSSGHYANNIDVSQDKIYFLGFPGHYDNRLNITDSTYNDVTSFKNSLAGVMLYYELAEPQVYVLDDDVLPLMYKVDELGTEQVLPECTEETPCCAPILSVNYAMNAVAQLRNMHTNYISKASFDNYLNLVNSTLVSVLGGTISVNPTQTNDAYTFAFNEVSNMVVFVSNGSQITDVIGNFPPDSYINNGKAKFYLRHDNALIPLSVAYTGSITAVGVYSPYGSNDTYTVRFSGEYSTSIIGATVNVEQIN